MNRKHMFFAIAPIALVAACSNNADTVDTDEAVVAEADTGDAAASASSNEPTAPTRLADAGDFSGDYSLAGPDGTTTRVTLDSKAGTYSYVGNNGQQVSGKYAVNNDGYRFVIDDYYGRPAYFVLSEGSLVRLPMDMTLEGNDITVTGERYTRDDGAQFSREPELGSPVVPEDMVERSDE